MSLFLLSALLNRNEGNEYDDSESLIVFSFIYNMVFNQNINYYAFFTQYLPTL